MINFHLAHFEETPIDGTDVTIVTCALRIVGGFQVSNKELAVERDRAKEMAARNLHRHCYGFLSHRLAELESYALKHTPYYEQPRVHQLVEELKTLLSFRGPGRSPAPTAETEQNPLEVYWLAMKTVAEGLPFEYRTSLINTAIQTVGPVPAALRDAIVHLLIEPEPANV